MKKKHMTNLKAADQHTHTPTETTLHIKYAPGVIVAILLLSIDEYKISRATCGCNLIKHTNIHIQMHEHE